MQRSAERTDVADLDCAVAKARNRLLPFLVLMYVLAFIDRSNVGFAKNVLQADTGIGDAAFAFGASIFFVGYALFEVPSNLLMYRFGARIWMSRIMITWGVVSTATAFVQGPTSFYVLRFILGVNEAGFFPGIILYLTCWFPNSRRGQAVGIFYFGLPLSLILGSPFSGLLLDLKEPFGLHAWQWLFIIEGLLASVVGGIAFFYLVDRPSRASWLNDAERDALTQAIDAEETEKRRDGPATLLATIRNRHVIFFCMIYFTIQISVYGVVFFLPTRIANLTGGGVGTIVGLLTAIPWLTAICATLIITRIADRSGRQRRWAAAMLGMAALGIAASGFCNSVPLAILTFCFAACGFVAVQPLFWSLPTGYLGGAAAAGGIGLINSIGNLGGFVAPNLKDFAERISGRPEMGMVALSVAGIVGAALLMGFAAKPSSSPTTPETALRHRTT